MKVEAVKKLGPIDQLLYWIKERHQIHYLRLLGNPKPWTDDEVLQRFFFTNPYRENDKTTVWFREHVRDPLREEISVVMATIVFRWFNYIPTGEVLWGYGANQEGVCDLLTGWNQRIVLRLLGTLREQKKQIFTGAYMINSPGGEPKLEAICRRIENVWRSRKSLELFFRGCDWDRDTTLAGAHEFLTQYDGLGGFMAYEVITDLRHTRWLEKAKDIMTWCNPGPGCIRGLYRILGLPFEKGNNATSPPKPKDWLEQMQKLLKTINRRLPETMPRFEMRELEHSLCEYDKYMRALLGDGKMKRTFQGT